MAARSLEPDPAGAVTLIANTGNDPVRERERVAALQGHRCDGYILASATLDGTAAAPLTSAAAPVVLVNREIGDVSMPSVGSDDRAGVQTVIGHLASLGHWVIADPTGPPNLSVVRTRAEAFRSCSSVSMVARTSRRSRSCCPFRW